MLNQYINSDMHDNFNDDGYICIDSVFDSEQMNKINNEVDRFIVDVVPTMPNTHVYYENKSNKTSLKQLQKMFEYDDFFQNLMHNSIIREIAETVLQDEVVAINMQYFNKPPNMPQPTPPHQDGYYFHLKPCQAVTGWLALEDVDEENGCIHYVKSSHKINKFRPHGQTGVLGFSQGITDFGTQKDQQNKKAFPGKAGTFLMHHAKTIHWASGNMSKTRSRRALGFIYYAKQAKIDLKAKHAYQRKLDNELQMVNKI